MRTIRNVAVFIGALVLVTLAVSVVLLPIYSRLINGGSFVTYFGWFSWADATFPLLLALLFFSAGVLLSFLLRSRAVAAWAFALGLCYSLLRLAFTWASLGGERSGAIYLWIAIELSVPAIAAWAGAWLAGRARPRHRGDAPGRAS
jgi:hypothetical protein